MTRAGLFACLVCMGLGACSRLFALNTVAVDDRDGDRVPDPLDNCPDKANTDQSDIDGDGVGDACQGCQSPSGLDDDHDGIPNECDGCDNRGADLNHDAVPDACETLNDAGMIVLAPVDASSCPTCQPCLLGPAHDEDGDTFADACDACPAFPLDITTDTLDPDGDGIDALCDTSSGLPSHQLFDPFTTPNQLWFDTGGTWTVTHDELRINPGGNTYLRSLGVGTGDFVARTKVTFGSATATANAGVFVLHRTAASIDELWTCQVYSNGSGSTSVALSNGQLEVRASAQAAASYTIALEYTKEKLICLVNGTAGSIANPGANLDPWLSGLTAHGADAIAFQWYQFATDN